MQTGATAMVCGVGDLTRAPLGYTGVEYLALPGEIVERHECFLQRRFGIVPMALIQVQIVHAETLQ